MSPEWPLPAHKRGAGAIRASAASSVVAAPQLFESLLPLSPRKREGVLLGWTMSRHVLLMSAAGLTTTERGVLRTPAILGCLLTTPRLGGCLLITLRLGRF